MLTGKMEDDRVVGVHWQGDSPIVRMSCFRLPCSRFVPVGIPVVMVRGSAQDVSDSAAWHQKI